MLLMTIARGNRINESLFGLLSGQLPIESKKGPAMGKREDPPEKFSAVSPAASSSYDAKGGGSSGRKDALSPEGIAEGLDTGLIGRHLYVYDELISTNVTAHEMADSGAPEGTAIIADSQTGGKGRRGRSWFSPPGDNIYTSVILRPPVSPDRAPQLTLVAAVALAETISCSLAGVPPVKTNLKARIKWPNDILVEGKKCAGILTEMKAYEGRVLHVVLGVGINVNLDAQYLPEELSPFASSLFIMAGQFFPRIPILQSLYINMENWYKKYLDAGFPAIRERWNRLSAVTGRSVRAASSPGTENGYEEGIALGINNEGALMLRKDDGRIVDISAGEISLISVE